MKTQKTLISRAGLRHRPKPPPVSAEKSRCRSVQLNQTEAECFFLLPLDDHLLTHIPEFVQLARACRRAEGLECSGNVELVNDIVFYCAMFSLFRDTGRLRHPAELVMARWHQAESDPEVLPAVLRSLALPVATVMSPAARCAHPQQKACLNGQGSQMPA